MESGLAIRVDGGVSDNACRSGCSLSHKLIHTALFAIPLAISSAGSSPHVPSRQFAAQQMIRILSLV